MKVFYPRSEQIPWLRAKIIFVASRANSATLSRQDLLFLKESYEINFPKSLMLSGYFLNGGCKGFDT
jgi:hypothetical protein